MNDRMMNERAQGPGCPPKTVTEKRRWETKYEDTSFFPFDAAAGPPDGCRIAAAKTDHGAMHRLNGLKMYYEIHGSGEPVVLLHGAFMTSTNNWSGWIYELSKTRRVIAVEMQGHGRTADIKRDISPENLEKY